MHLQAESQEPASAQPSTAVFSAQCHSSSLHSCSESISVWEKNCFPLCSTAPDLSSVFFLGHPSWVSLKPALQSTLQIGNADVKKMQLWVFTLKMASPLYGCSHSLTSDYGWKGSCHSWKALCRIKANVLATKSVIWSWFVVRWHHLCCAIDYEVCLEEGLQCLQHWMVSCFNSTNPGKVTFLGTWVVIRTRTHFS